MGLVAHSCSYRSLATEQGEHHTSRLPALVLLRSDGRSVMRVHFYSSTIPLLDRDVAAGFRGSWCRLRIEAVVLLPLRFARG